MKPYTDIEQSKKLAEILPVESADMCYYYKDDKPQLTPYSEHNNRYYIPCWSLAALLGVMLKGEGKDLALVFGSDDGGYHPLWFCTYEETPTILEICAADNPIDACVETIIRLHEQKLL